MEGSLKGILERYEQLVLAKRDLTQGLETTLQLLRDLKAGNVDLKQVVVTEDGWQLAPTPEPHNGKVIEREFAKEAPWPPSQPASTPPTG